MRRVALALLLGLRIAGDEGGVEGVLMIVIVREGGMDLGQRQIRIRLDDGRRPVAVSDVIGDDVEHPMAGAVEARNPAGVQGDVGRGRVLRHACPPARVIRAR
jgi:hypothetical protein